MGSCQFSIFFGLHLRCAVSFQWINIEKILLLHSHVMMQHTNNDHFGQCLCLPTIYNIRPGNWQSGTWKIFYLFDVFPNIEWPSRKVKQVSNDNNTFNFVLVSKMIIRVLLIAIKLAHSYPRPEDLHFNSFMSVDIISLVQILDQDKIQYYA